MRLINNTVKKYKMYAHSAGWLGVFKHIYDDDMMIRHIDN